MFQWIHQNVGRISHLHLVLVVLVLSISKLQATTIIPFEHLGAMAEACDAVVMASVQQEYEATIGGKTYHRYQLSIIELVKGDLVEGSTIELQAMRHHTNELAFEPWGDLRLEVGRTYLLFLNERNSYVRWYPMMLAYGIHEQFEVNGVKYLVPTPTSQEISLFERPDGQEIEPLFTYPQDLMLKRLIAHIDGQKEWNGFSIRSNINPIGFFGHRAAPSHCSFIDITGTPMRWPDFDIRTLEVYSDSDGDTEMVDPTTVHGYCSDAVGQIGGNYTGTDMSYEGTTNFTPDCSDNEAAADAAFQNHMFSLNGYYSGMVQYNDPCSEIDDLMGCNGTLAFGGLYKLTEHSFDGDTWGSGAYGYVVVNNGVAACLGATAYTQMLAHELTHTLGAGHIPAASGAANMNPSCCNAITSLDIDCQDYTYPTGLPIELLSFEGHIDDREAKLTWETISELDNALFVIERSVDGGNFEVIGELPGAGNSQQLLSYNFSDKLPRSGVNYYRLKQIDYDGTFSYSDVIALQLKLDVQIAAIYPNPVDEDLYLNFATEAVGEVQISIFSVDGRLLFQNRWQAFAGVNEWQIATENIQKGLYYIKVEQDGFEEMLKFTKL